MLLRSSRVRVATWARIRCFHGGLTDAVRSSEAKQRKENHSAALTPCLPREMGKEPYFAESAIGKIIAGAVLLLGAGTAYLGAAHYGVGPRTVSESAIRECAVRTLTDSSFTLPESHPSKDPESGYVKRCSTRDDLRALFETSTRRSFWVCVGSKASGKTSLLEEVASEATNLSVVYLRISDGGDDDLKKQLVLAMGINDLVVSSDLSVMYLKDLFIRCIAVAAKKRNENASSEPEGDAKASHIVVVLDDLNRARNAPEPKYFLQLQGFLKDLCLGANVVVIGAVPSASDVAYMKIEPRREYHTILDFTNDELRSYMEKRGFSDECATEIIKHYMPPIGFVKALVDKLPPKATKEMVTAAIDAEREKLIGDCNFEKRKQGLLKIKKAGSKVSVGKAGNFFEGEDITRPGSQFFPLVENNHVLVWSPSDRTLSLKFPIQQEAVHSLE